MGVCCCIGPQNGDPLCPCMMRAAGPKDWIFPEKKTKRIGDREVPVIPPLPEDFRPDYEPNPVVAVCGECGLELRRVMGYVCPNPRCPCQMKITC